MGDTFFLLQVGMGGCACWWLGGLAGAGEGAGAGGGVLLLGFLWVHLQDPCGW